MLKSFLVYKGRHILVWFCEHSLFTFYVLGTVLDAYNTLMKYYLQMSVTLKATSLSTPQYLYTDFNYFYWK